MVAHGCAACVMEVSSHALALKRADYLRFAAAIFTNLTRDHLDFHRNMDDYFAAKRRLFELLPEGAVAVVNLDDRRGAQLLSTAKRLDHLCDRRRRGRPAGQPDVDAGWLGFDVTTRAGCFTSNRDWSGARTPTTSWRPSPPPLRSIRRRAPSKTESRDSTAVPGRFQLVSDARDDVRVVDYAHTDDALKNLLETARPIATGRILTVFGCGGDRDRTKRPLMGAAARLSDLVVVTSDNPRSENQEIIDQIKRGIVAPRIAAAGAAGSRRGDPLHCDRRPEGGDRARCVRRRRETLILMAGKGTVLTR